MNTEDSNGSPGGDHWQSISEELGADFDPDRAAPVQPNQDIERLAAEKRAAAVPREPLEPAPFPTIDDLLKEPKPTTVRARPSNGVNSRVAAVMARSIVGDVR